MRGAASSSTWLWAILVVAAALRLFPVWFGFPYPYARPDEAVAIGHAMDVLGGDLNPRFFHWPSLTFYAFATVLGLTSAVTRVFTGDPALSMEAATIAARVFVALAGTLTVLAAWRLGRRFADAATGLVAAALLAVAILHVRDSHFAMTDVLMTLLVTASLVVLLRATDEGMGAAGPGSLPLRPFAAAGLLGGLAASTKYNAAAIVCAMAAAQLLLLVRFRRELSSPRVWLPAMVFGAAFAGGFVLATPYAVLDYKRFSADLIFDFTHLSTGHGVNLGRGWLYHLTHSLPYGAGPITFALAVAGLPLAAWRHPRHSFVVLSFAAAFYVAIGSGYTVFFRYVLPLVPIVCLLAAIAVGAAASWLARHSALSEGVAVALAGAIAAAPSLVNCVWFDVLLARTDTRVLAGAWLAERLEAGDTVHDAGGDYARLELGATRFHYWWFDASADSFGHPQGLRPDWLVLTQSPLRTYANAPAALRRIAQEHYALVHISRGTTGAAGSAIYDLQDAFFMPIFGFQTVTRPGPTILIYRRRGLPPR